MARFQQSFNKKLLVLYLLLVFLTSTTISHNQKDYQSFGTSGRRMLLLEIEDDDQGEEPAIKNKSSSTSTVSSGATKISTNNSSTKLLIPPPPPPPPTSNSSKNQTKLIIKSPSEKSAKNKTKLIIIKSSASTTSPTLKSSPQIIKKLNSTSKSPSNSTSKATITKKKPSSSDLGSSKTKVSKPTTTSKAQLEKGVVEPKPKKPQKKQQPSWIDDDEDDDDLVAEFRDLPSKFQESIMPDLERISETSRSYLTKYNKEFTKGFKPYVGNKYASTIASFVSFAFIIIPLILVSLIFNRIKAYFSLLKLLIFIQIYLAIYFTILCLSSLVTGLEPLRFFYSTSQSTYVCVQVFQTLAYVLYLMLLLMFLVLVFSTETGMATKMLGLGQTFVGFAVGLHYYMTVFHRAVLRQPPKTSWKVHAIYATCFLAICLLGRVDRSKKAYLEEGGEEGKRS